MTYCYRCRLCGATATDSQPDALVTCNCGVSMIRDYRAEAVYVAPVKP